jgi:hypothetical protein
VDRGLQITASHERPSLASTTATSYFSSTGTFAIVSTPRRPLLIGAFDDSIQKKKMPDVDLAIVIRHLSMCSSKD